MNNILLNDLEKRREYLYKVVAEKDAFINNCPEGSLRTATHDGQTSYYRVTEFKDSSGKYISKKDIRLIKDLAQKDYDSKVIRRAEKELVLLDRLIKYQDQSIEEIYNSLSPVRQKLVTPVRLPDDEFIRQWMESKKCEPMGFDEMDPIILTSEGYRVRSKSEQLWADSFKRFNVPHVFEPKLYLKGKGWVRPDFVGLNVRLRKEIWVEHMGMMDMLSYSEENVRKLHLYERNGYVLGDNLLITMETRRSPLEAKSIEAMITKHFL